MIVTVKTLKGEVFSIEIEPEDLLLTLKQKIEIQAGTPVSEQRIVCAGKQWDDDEKPLSSYGIKEGAVIYSMISLRGD